MTDRVHILNEDTLDEDLLAEAFGRTGISDYVERDLDIRQDDVDFSNAVVDIPPGKAYVLDNGRDSMLLPDARPGVSLATDGINHIYIYYDLSQPEGERIGYHVDSDQTPPPYPHLRIAAIDMAAQDVSRPNHTAPIYRRDAETYKGNDIDPDGDGVVLRAEEAGVADSANAVDGEDVVGAVPDADALGVAADTADIQAPTDVRLNPLENIGRLDVGTEHNGSRYGWRLKSDGDEGAGKSLLVPIFGGSEDPGNAIEYNNSALFSRKGYILHAGTYVEGELDIGVNDGLYVQVPGGDQVWIVPKINEEYQRRNKINYSNGNWTFEAPIKYNDDLVLDESDESSLDVNSADTAGSATTAGTASVAETLSKKEKARILRRSPNFHTGQVRLDPSQRVNFGPFAMGGSNLEIWKWGVMSGDGSNADQLRLRLRDADGNQYDATNSALTQGNPSNLDPIETVTSSQANSRFIFQLFNGTGETRTVSGFAGYLLG
ncbi:hypothetical protein [Halococcus sp. PRR34]|uniref:hypothetical protein n=1 Tax=Halococcus sp. PRR34 TaxID=3020830 RepID=UPI0023627687|nr:hypothetical protein [Halococcus sp. PRR34]